MRFGLIFALNPVDMGVSPIFEPLSSIVERYNDPPILAGPLLGKKDGVIFKIAGFFVFFSVLFAKL